MRVAPCLLLGHLRRGGGSQQTEEAVKLLGAVWRTLKEQWRVLKDEDCS